jgi:SAM-dependent methyltransferase
VEPKPAQWGWEHGSAWLDEETARAYLSRPPHPDETFEVLARLGARGGRVLDLGTGTAEIARRLVGIAAGVDAVDVSPSMLSLARRLPGGDHATIRWIQGPVESVPLHPPYDLATAGDSIHWMDWGPLFARLATVLCAKGRLVLLNRDDEGTAWQGPLREVFRRRSANRDWLALDIVEELQRRELFEVEGRHVTAPVPVRQTLSEYLDLLHSRSGLSRVRMGSASSRAFDEEVLAIVRPYLEDDRLTYPVSGSLVWGRVAAPGG